MKVSVINPLGLLVVFLFFFIRLLSKRGKFGEWRETVLGVGCVQAGKGLKVQTTETDVNSKQL